MRAGRASSLIAIFRPQESDGAHASRPTTYSEETYAWVQFVDPRPGLQNYGAGERPAGSATLVCRWTVDLRERDVIDVQQGPHTGERWKVEGRDGARPDTTITLKRFNGKLQ